MEAVSGWTVIVLGLFYSVWLRTNRYRQEISFDARVSPLSLALQDLISAAGGIYLSLVMFLSFLKVTLPEQVVIFSVAVDPLAFLALCLGIVQPFLTNLIKKVK